MNIRYQWSTSGSHVKDDGGDVGDVLEFVLCVLFWLSCTSVVAGHLYWDSVPLSVVIGLKTSCGGGRKAD